MAEAGLEKKLLAGGLEERITPLLVVCCMVAASGGFLAGYEHGVAGGVTSMASFLREFFPGIYAEMKEDSKTSNYCKFNSQLLTLFNSSLYISGLFASLFASHATTRLGRRFSMRFSGVFTFAGAIIGGTAVNLSMLISSRILLGFGMAFANQSIALYLSEIAPAMYRGAIFNFYDMSVTGAFVTASVVNYLSQKIETGWGWRISLGTAVLPASFLAIGSMFIPETPTSLIQRGGDLHEASCLLQRIRGTSNVGEELDQLIAAAVEAPVTESAGMRPLRRIVQRKYRPQLVLAIAFPIFQELAGMSLVGFYAPLMFRTIGQAESASLLSVVAMRMTATITNLVATPLIDRLGRRTFFFIGGFELFLSLVTAGGIMGVKLGDHGRMSSEYAKLMVGIFCLFVSGFAWSLGPLPMLVTTEVFPLEIRSAGRSISVAVGFLFMSVMAQGMLFVLCQLKWVVFFVFGSSMVLMTLFVFFFVPETKGLKLEEMERVWTEHWYWKRFV